MEIAGSRKWSTLAAVCTGVFMLLLDLTIVNVALPDIERAFHASFSDLQWVIDAYALTLAAFLLTVGSLADLYGRRLLFAIGLTVFTLGSPATGVAALGTIFASHVRSTVTDQLSGGPLGGHASALGHAIGSGWISRALTNVPPALHPAVLRASRAGFVDGLNTILLIGAAVAFTAAAISLLLVRERDMALHPGQRPSKQPPKRKNHEKGAKQ